MLFRVQCHCGKEAMVPAAKAGSSVICSSCGDALRVPALSVLREFASQDLAAPESTRHPSSGSRAGRKNANQWPESFFVRCCGEVGSFGSVSSTAMENYVGCVFSRVDAFLKAIDTPEGFEVAVSCAILQHKKVLIHVAVEPQHDWVEQLETMIRGIEAPPIEGLPVAFAFYRRIRLLQPTMTHFIPFPNVADKIQAVGMERALVEASGEVWPEASRWTRFKSILKQWLPHRDRKPTPEDAHRSQSQWLSGADDRSQGMRLREIEGLCKREPDDAFNTLTLAAKYLGAEKWDLALRAYEKVIHQQGESPSLLARRGRAHGRGGNTQAALADYNRALELLPTEAWFYYWRAEIYCALEAWTKALEDLDLAVLHAPREPVMTLSRAHLRRQMDQARGAIEDLHQTLVLDPHCGEAHLLLGQTLHNEESAQLSEAIQHYDSAVSLLPEDISARIYRSLALISEGKYALALEDCDHVLRQDSNVASAHGIRGRILQLEGDYDEAIAACSAAIDLGLENAMVYLSRAFSYAATDELDLARADCAAALNLEPENALACHLQGQLNLQSGDLAGAMDAFRQARELDPDWAEPREHMAYVHRMNEDPQAAVREQSELIEKQPERSSHFVNRALAYVQLGDFPKAVEDYDRAVELDPENEQIFFLRGGFRFERQEYELALRDFDRALEISDQHDAARLYRAYVYVALKRHSDAARDYARLIDKYPDDPRAYAGRAYVHGLTGNEEAAEADIERLNELNPEHAEQHSAASLMARIVALRLDGRSSDALELADELIDLAPEESIGFRARAGLHWDEEELVEALDDYTRALDIEISQAASEDLDSDSDDSDESSNAHEAADLPESSEAAELHTIEANSPEVLSARGQVQAEMGEWQAAMVDLNQAIKLSRKSGETLTLAHALSGRALALAGLQQWDDSTRDYQESISLSPKNPWAHYHRGLQLFQRGELDEAKTLLERAIELSDPPLPPRKRQRAQLALSQALAQLD